MIATIGIVLTAAYVLRFYQRTATGPTPSALATIKDLRGREITALAPVALLTIVLGVFPGPVLDVVNPAVDRTLSIVGITDPPTVLDLEEVSQP